MVELLHVTPGANCFAPPRSAKLSGPLGDLNVPAPGPKTLGTGGQLSFPFFFRGFTSKKRIKKVRDFAAKVVVVGGKQFFLAHIGAPLCRFG